MSEAETPTAPLLWTPAAVKDRARRLHLAVRNLARDINRARARWTEEDFQAWRAWVDEGWVPWWSSWHDTPVTGPGYWGATVTTLERWESELARWAELQRANGGRVTDVPSRVRRPDPVGALSPVLLVVGLVAVAMMLRSGSQ